MYVRHFVPPEGNKSSASFRTASTSSPVSRMDNKISTLCHTAPPSIPASLMVGARSSHASTAPTTAASTTATATTTKRPATRAAFGSVDAIVSVVEIMASVVKVRDRVVLAMSGMVQEISMVGVSVALAATIANGSLEHGSQGEDGEDGSSSSELHLIEQVEFMSCEDVLQKGPSKNDDGKIQGVVSNLCRIQSSTTKYEEGSKLAPEPTIIY